MASNPPEPVEDPFNTETEEETIALKKKRSRRVSFADREITSVHIFNRDEEYETPPDPSAPKQSSGGFSEAEKEVLGFFRDLADTDDSKEMSPDLDEESDDDEDMIKGGRSFLRPLRSPSPGSSNFGSATSNDEDNFFGPVSTDFIRIGQQSDSAASDDNHDVTMDSTAFSMHYRSLARSDSGGNMFEEKTPSQVATPSDSGSSIVLTKVNKIIPQFSFSSGDRDSNDMSLVGENPRNYGYEKLSPNLKVILAGSNKDLQDVSVSFSSGDRDSNDMSLVGEKPRNYGYEKLSPNLEVFLAISNKDLQDVSVSASPNKNASKSSDISMFDENMGDHIDQRDDRDKETGNVGKLGLSPGGASAVCMELDELNGNSFNTLDGLIASGCSSHRDEDSEANIFVNQRLLTPNQLAKVSTNYRKDVNGINTLNVEFPSGDHQSINGEVSLLDSSGQHEYRDNPDGSSHVKRRGNKGIGQKFDQQKSPVHGFISSVSAKQRDRYLDTAIAYVTPSPKQPNPFLGKGNIKSIDKFFSDNKSISKFQTYEPSPLASALKERIESSKLRLSKLPFDAVAEGSCKSVERKNVDTVVGNLEKHLFRSDANDRFLERTDHVDCSGVKKQKECDSLSKDGQSECLAEDRISVISMSNHVSFEGANQLISRMASPSQFSQLQKNERQHNSVLEKFVQQKAVVSGSDSSLVDIRLDNENDAKAISIPDEFVSPTAKTSEKMSCSSTERLCIPLHDLQSDEMVSMSLGQDKSSVGKVISNSNSTVITDVVRESFVDERAQSSSPLLDINGIMDFTQVGNSHDRQNHPTVLKRSPETLPISRSSSRERNAQKVLSGTTDTGLVHSEKEVPREWNEASPPSSTSHHDISRRIKKIAKRPFKKAMSKSPIKEPTHSPSRNDQHGISNNENVQSFAEKIIVSPSSNVNGRVDNDNHLNGIPAQNIENSSERKRRFGEPVAENADKYRRVKKSPEIHTSEDANLECVLQHTITSDNIRQNTRSDQMMKHWSDILQKFSKDTEQLLSPLTEKLNTKLLRALQDIVLHLQKVKFFEMLHSQIQSQKMRDQSSEIRLNRVAETKMLLYTLAYKKARLQLMRMEREKVLKKSQQLSSAVHKSQMLKLNRPCLLLSGNRDSAVNNSLTCSSDMNRKIELSREKLAAMKNEFEVLDRKIKNLTKSFNSYLKMKGESSSCEIIAQLNVHVKKKTSCKIIHDDLQLWELVDFESMNLKRRITLNYRGLFCQRFLIDDSPTPSVSVSNNLDDINITKNFPNTDACTAFEWALNARSKKKLLGFKKIVQEIRITCSLLHSLLDVIGEVQLALVEIRNLVQTRFCSSSVEQLQLQLCFIDFNNGWKMMMTLDMTCLNRGVYPSEVVPSQLEVSVAGTGMPLPEPLLARIKAAVDGVGTGYSRIIRLCRCISQVLCSPRAH